VPFYYSIAASHTTAAGAATQTLAADTRGGATGRAYGITRLIAGAKSTAQDNQTLWQAWRPTVVNTVGSAQVAEKHDVSAPAAGTTFQITPTVGTKGAFPVVQLPFNSRAMVQWVALNPDEALYCAGLTSVTGNMAFYSEQAAAVAVVIVYQVTWAE
jgi:acyl CoA:acetate/3-ketoacid CoA transferase alpha subunit